MSPVEDGAGCQSYLILMCGFWQESPAAMAYFIGVDEAGYGPRIGPLVLAATVWRIPFRHHGWDAAASDQHRQLAAPSPHSGWGSWWPHLDHRDRNDADEPCGLAVGDSKNIFRRSNAGLARLEHTVLAACWYTGRSFRSWRQLFQQVLTWEDDSWARLPWYRDYDESLPVSATAVPVQEAVQAWDQLQRTTKVDLCGVQVAAVFPEKYNEWSASCNKAFLLTERTLLLVRACLAEWVPTDADLFVLCDRHGGRRYYAGAVQQFLEASEVAARWETAQESHYRVRLASGQTLEIAFLVGADAAHPAVGLASMIAKYVRELAMRPFNSFWQRWLPELRPTAGYGTDAERFRREIAETCQKLGIHGESFWRQT